MSDIENKIEIEITPETISDPFPRDGDGFLRPPSLEDLHLHPGILEAALEISSPSESAGLERYDVELLVRTVVYADRLLRQE